MPENYTRKYSKAILRIASYWWRYFETNKTNSGAKPPHQPACAFATKFSAFILRTFFGLRSSDCQINNPDGHPVTSSWEDHWFFKSASRLFESIEQSDRPNLDLRTKRYPPSPDRKYWQRRRQQCWPAGTLRSQRTKQRRTKQRKRKVQIKK